MKLKRAGIFTAGAVGATVLGLYARHLLAIDLTVPEKEALANGDDLLQVGQNILAFTAHPDDLEIFMGGTIGLLSQGSANVTIVDVSDGEKGVVRRNLAATRIKEQQRAAAELNVDELEFLHLPDLHLAKAGHLEEAIKDVMLHIKPDLIFAFDYEYPFRAARHPDHLAVGRAVAEVKKAYLDYAILAYYATRQPNALIDIAATLQEKVEAIRCHRSQLRFNNKLYDYLVMLLARYSARHTSLESAELFRV